MATKFHHPTFSKNFLRRITQIKSPDAMLEDASSEGLEKTLGVWDLIILGIGAIIGAGIFAIVGVAAAGQNGAGPALAISMIIAAFACVFSALCYCEFATMIPVAGGAYTYTFATLGEFAAWMVGWVLLLEYAIGFIVVAAAWSNHFVQFMKGFSNVLPSWISNPPIWLVSDIDSATKSLTAEGVDPATVIPTIHSILPNFGIMHFFAVKLPVFAHPLVDHIANAWNFMAQLPICLNIPAALVIILSTMILIKGTKDSAKMTAIMVVIKIAVIALFVLVGLFYVKPANWVPFAPNGFSGIFNGAFLIFFAYIGFDAIATVAEECKNPQRDLPIGIIGSLVAATIVYVLVALVMTGMYPTSGHVPAEFIKAPMAFVMSEIAHQDWVAGLISIGSLAGLTSVLLVMELAAIRVLYAMSRDNFIPKTLQALHEKFHTPYVLTWLVGILSVIGVMTLDLQAAAELCNFGTFTSFIVVCVAVLILRHTDPDRNRPFKVPFSPWFPMLGIICCGGLMVYKLMQSGESNSALLFPVWLGLGAIIYFNYGFRSNRKYENEVHLERVEQKKLELYK